MEIHKDIQDNKTVVSLSGRIDSTASIEFEQEMVQIINEGTYSMVIDFLNVQFISSAGLRILLLVAKKTKPYGGQIVLCNLSDDVYEVFNISGFASIFKISPNVSEALKMIG